VYVAGVPVRIVASSAVCRSLNLVERTVSVRVLVPGKGGGLDVFGGFKRGDAEPCLEGTTQGCCQAELFLLETSSP
jgi:hypothetical protein